VRVFEAVRDRKPKLAQQAMTRLVELALRDTTGAQWRKSHEAAQARQPKRSEGNPTKRHRRDVGHGTTEAPQGKVYRRA
jgi:hypothetical protein